MWEAAAGRNTGGVVLHDPQTGTFFGTGISPAGYDPNWFQTPPTFALFRFAALVAGEPPFVHLEDLGEPCPSRCTKPPPVSEAAGKPSSRSSETSDPQGNPRGLPLSASQTCHREPGTAMAHPTPSPVGATLVVALSSSSRS